MRIRHPVPRAVRSASPTSSSVIAWGGFIGPSSRMTPLMSIARRPSNTPMSPKRWNSAHVQRTGRGPPGAVGEDGTDIVVTAIPPLGHAHGVILGAFPEYRRGHRASVPFLYLPARIRCPPIAPHTTWLGSTLCLSCRPQAFEQRLLGDLADIIGKRWA